MSDLAAFLGFCFTHRELLFPGIDSWAAHVCMLAECSVIQQVLHNGQFVGTSAECFLRGHLLFIVWVPGSQLLSTRA